MTGPDAWLPLPLVGRQRELSVIRRALDAAARRETSTVVVAGGQGVGKTRLLEAALAEAEERGFTVAHGTASQTDADVPWSIITEAFTPVVRALGSAAINHLTSGTAADLARVVPAFDQREGRPQQSPPPDDLTMRVRWHFMQFLERLADKKPVVIAIDNAQWADPSSVGLVQFILRHAAHARVLVLAAHAPAESDVNAPFRAMQKALAGRQHVHQLTLEPLSQEHLRTLLATAFHVPREAVGEFAAALYDTTLGNAFFVEEMLKSLVERGVLRSVNGEWVGWSTQAFDLPPTVSEVVRSRVAALTQPARDLLDTLSAFSTRAADEVLADATGLSAADFVRAVEELRERHLVSDAESAGGITCDVTHPLIRRTAYEGLGTTRRRALHGRIVAAMERWCGDEADAHATELSYHCVRAGGAEVVAKGRRYLVTAGRAALARHADREAATYLQHAVDLATERDDTLLPLVNDLARARQRLGEYEAARNLWVQVRGGLAALADTAGLARVERRLGMLAMLTGDAQDALAHFDEALRHARAAARPDLVVSTLVSLGLALAGMGRLEEAKARAREALGLVEASGDVAQRARLERALLELYTFTGPADVARDYGRRALEHAAESGDRALEWSAHWASAVLAGLTADADGVVEHTREAAAIARDLNSPSLSAHVDEVAIEYAMAKGDWAEALRLSDGAIPVARAMAPRTLAPRILVWTGTVLLYRDELEPAKSAFDEAWELSRAGEGGDIPGDVHAVIVAHIGQAAYGFATKEWGRSIEWAQRGIALGDRYGIIAWSVHRLYAILAEAAWYNEQFDLTEAAGRRLREEAPRLGHRLGVLYAEAAEVFLSHLRHPDPGTVPALLDIAERAELVPYVFHAARLRRFAAKIMLAQGDRDGASLQYRLVHETFQRLGAAFELRLTREQMREQGWRPPVRLNGARGVLTPREVEVALLAADGRPNKDIGAALDISWRTVSRHLATIYGKLGVDSRARLGKVVRGMGEAG